MSRISLRAYYREIEGLIDQGHRLDEAVAHCRHILSTYPKHLETYRLLGKAYLEAKKYDQAVDIFQRVLVADPEDFVSHVGMSIIADDQGKLDDAIWHMERAFEVQPSNAAIQAELQRLFGRRDGVEPPKIRLTRGALAHMYVQGELYTQAISEIRAVLAHDKGRTDMQVLLARAHFRNGQKAEAAEVCAALLAISPYCFEANRLMAEFQPAAEATEATREYRRRVFEMDPYAQFSQGSIFNTDQVPDGSVTLERLEYTAGAAEVGPSLGISVEPTLGSSREEPSRPSWLTAEPGEASVPDSLGEIPDDVPDFIREGGWSEVKSTDAEVTNLGEPVEDSEPAAALGDLPEWVRALAPSEEGGQGAGTVESVWTAPDWGRQTEGADDKASVAHQDASGEQAPDWLKELAIGAEASPMDAEPAGTAEQADEEPFLRGSSGLAGKTRDPNEDLAWLEGLAEKHDSEPEELLTPPAARDAAVPQWILNARQSGSGTTESNSSPADGSEARAEGALSKAEPAPGSQVKEPLDWLSGLSDRDAFSQLEQQPEVQSSPIMGEDEAGALPSPAVGTPAGSLPEWLGGGAPPPDEIRVPIARESSGDDSVVSLPDWLAGLDKENPAAPSTPSEGAESESLPDWLKAEGPPIQEAASSAGGWHPPRMEQRPPAKEVLDSETMESTGVGLPAGIVEPAEEYERDGFGRSSEPLPARTRPISAMSTVSAPSLGNAQAEMGRGNIAAALDQYGRLIRRGRSLEEIIRDLRDALYRYPVEVPIWQALGDAYMRANRLQEALDAYTKAEELLR